MITIAEYQIECIFEPRDLEVYAKPWEAALEKLPVPTPHSSCAAIVSFAEHLLSPAETFCCLVATKDGKFCGALPLVVRKHSVLGRTNVVLAAVRHAHLVHVDIVTVEEDSVAVRYALLKSCRHFFPQFTRLDLTHIPDDSLTIIAVADPESKFHYAVQPQGFSAYFDTSVPIESYFAQLSKKFNKGVRTNLKQFFMLPDAHVDFLTGTDATDEAFDSFVLLESHGWKADKGGAISLKPELILFYRSIVEHFRQLGWLEIHRAHANSQIVAALIAIKIGRVLYPIKIAYDEAYAKYAPGKILVAKTIERAHADSATSMIDTLGESEWVARWTVDRRPLVKFSLYSSWLNCLLHGRLIPHIRSIAKKLPFTSKLGSAKSIEKNIP